MKTIDLNDLLDFIDNQLLIDKLHYSIHCSLRQRTTRGR